ncbi:MAG: bacillithiol biosynthesis deacetylase BshB1 [Gemmatimonadetes bacterium]|nr:bacillithiol biosynthesis deacetylase BshB1 [Gemmatimonadota bacterium]
MADLVAVMAHPDDAELLCGGALLRAVDQGHTTAVIDLTGGERGTAGSADTRREEAAAATRILRLEERLAARLPDSELRNTIAAVHTVAGLIRRLRPRTVILHWPEGRHPDHREASRIGYDACFIAGLKRAPVAGEPHRPAKIVYALSYREDTVRPTFVLDITEQMDRKIDAIFAYASQFEGKTAMGEAFGAGERSLRDQLRAHAAHWGSLIRRPFGEPYWTRETMRVDDLVTLPVNSI